MFTSLAFAALTVVGLHAAKPTKSVKPVSAPAPATAPAATDPVAPAAPLATVRKFVAVAPLASTSISRGEADLLGEALSTALQRRSGARMMERSQMEKILQEQGFQNSGACDKSDCAIQIGKILGIDQIVVGSVGKLGSSYMLNARLVDVATGEILGSTSRTSPARIEQVVAELPKAADDLFGTGDTGPTPPPTTTAAAPSGTQSVSVTISGKEEETYSVDVQKDDPYDTRFLLRGNLTMGCFLPTSPLSIAYAIEGDLRVSKRFWLNATYNQEIWGIYILDKTRLYDMDAENPYTDLPMATPGGEPSIFSVSLGGTYMVSQKEVNEPQSQVFSSQPLFSQQIGNSNFTAYHSKYMDVPVTYERSIGLRGGVMLERHPVLPDEGNGAFLSGEGLSSLQDLHIASHTGYVKSADTTNGWTNEFNFMAYLGASREYRQGSSIEFTRNENGNKYQVAKFYHSVLYADVMINLVTILDEVTYSGKFYGVEHGDGPGQIPARLLGIRAGYTVQSGKLLGFPLSGELGWLPGSGSMYVKFNLGLGLRI